MPQTLFITPVTPRSDGHGLVQRAFQVMRGLAADATVHVLVTNVLGGEAPPSDADAAFAETLAICARPWPWDLRSLARGWSERAHPLATRRPWIQSAAGRVFGRRPPEWPSPIAVRAASRHLPRGVRFDRVHVFRLYSAPFARRFLTARGPRVGRIDLDLDDIESLAHGRLAALAETRGEPLRAAIETALSRHYEALEDQWLPRFDRVYVCSGVDRERVLARHASLRVCCLPNVVDGPAQAAPLASASRDAPQLLFVGAMGHPPNDDAVRFFVDEVMPRLPAGARLHVVGARLAPDTAAHLRASGRCELHGWVADLGPHYAAAHVVVVPLRSGGGTRIKILEAFAHGRPVVSTSVGAEGLDVVHDTHLMIADAPQALAGHCAVLAAEGALASRLVAAGRELVAQRYGPAALALALRD